MSLRVGIPSIGMRAALSKYQQFESDAVAAARRNNAALWYVGNDPDGWVYEDSTGTLPATGTDPIGLLLDRSYGTGNLGPELVSNPGGPFTSTTGYTVTTDGGVTGGTQSIVGGSLRIQNDASGTNFGVTQIPITCVVGKHYRVSFVRNGGTGAGYGYIGTGVTAGSAISIAANIISTRYQFTATQTTHYIGIGAGGSAANQYYDWGAVSVREVLGYPALQSTSANRPTLELQANGYYGMRFDGVSDFLSVAYASALNNPCEQFIAAINAPAAAATRIVIGSPFVAGANNTPFQNYSIALSNVGDVWNLRTGSSVDQTISMATAVPAVATYETRSRKFYVNGLQVADYADATPVNTNSTEIRIGANGLGAETFFGLGALFCASPTVLPAPDRIAIERFAALLSGASYTG